MKNIFFILLTSIVILSCGKDDPACTADQFIGAYTGSESCSSLGTTNTSYTATFSAGSNSNKVKFTDSKGRDYEMTIDGCALRYNDTVFGNGIVIEFNRADDGTLTGSVLTKAVTATIEDCAISLTK